MHATVSFFTGTSLWYLYTHKAVYLKRYLQLNLMRGSKGMHEGSRLLCFELHR